MSINDLGNKLLSIAEEKFGERNPTKFHGFKRWWIENKPPQVIGNDEEGRTIYVSFCANRQRHEIFECAHEIFHILTPTSFKNVSVFEEGLATRFSIDALKIFRYHEKIINHYLTLIDGSTYKNAFNYISDIKIDYALLIKQIRNDYPNTLLSDLSANQLKVYDCIPNNIIPSLISKFNVVN